MDRGIFIIIDGIDGSGKSTIIKNWATELECQSKKVFNLKEYWFVHYTHPTAEELMDYDVIISAEPTNVWIGAAIRGELIQHGTHYSTTTIADAYALDRLILYKRLLLPLREAGKIILQDRSVSTSLCYQSIQDDPLTMKDIAAREGNAFTLSHAPDHFVIADVDVDVALSRLGGRNDKQDNAIFEKQDFLQKARTTFLDKTYQNYFTKHGTHIHILDCNANLAIMKERSIKLLSTLIS